MMLIEIGAENDKSLNYFYQNETSKPSKNQNFIPVWPKSKKKQAFLAKILKSFRMKNHFDIKVSSNSSIPIFTESVTFPLNLIIALCVYFMNYLCTKVYKQKNICSWILLLSCFEKNNAKELHILFYEI